MSTSVVASGGGNSLPSNNYQTADWGAPPPPDRGNAAIQQLITRTLAAIKRYRWLILVVFVVGSAAGIAATRFVKPKYTVDGTIWIAENQGGRGGPVQAPGLISSDLGWSDLVRSFAILDAVVSKLGLYVRPASSADTALFRALQPTDSLITGRYRLTTDPNRTRYTLTRLAEERGGSDRVVETGAIGDSIGKKAGFNWQPQRRLFRDETSFEFEVLTPREAAVTLQRQLVVAQPLNSNLMRLGLQGEHSGLLAATLNEVMRQFRRESDRLKKENLEEVANTVDLQLKMQQDRLYEAEVALESFKIGTITQPTENVAIAPGVSTATNPVMTAYFADRQTLENIRADREQLESIMRESGTNGRLSIEALRGAPSILASGDAGRELSTAINDLSTRQVTLRNLRQRYTDDYKLVKDELAAIDAYETQIIPQYASKLLAQLRSSESELNRRVSGAARELQKIPARTIEEGRRQRAVNVANTIFQDLQNRAVSARLAEQTVMPDIAILDTAVAPRRPSSDTTMSIILLAVVASLGLGLGLAILLDRIDGRFRYPEQAVDELGLDIMGAVPSYTAPRSQRQRLEQASQMVESFRSLALSVRSSFPPGSPVQLTVSSPGPGDGKSTISINLGNALAEGGYRTLLIDGDIRRGQLHESCPPATQAPGLLDHLAGEATLGEVIRPTDLHVNLSLIPCGTRRRQGPELLASQRMSLMLRELRSQFDAIVVDCAPLGAGIDAYALGTATGSMLLVLRAGETDRRLASSKLSTLDRMPIRILGAVLNDIGESPEFRYYHYLEGYGSPESVPEVALIGSGGSVER